MAIKINTKNKTIPLLDEIREDRNLKKFRKEKESSIGINSEATEGTIFNNSSLIFDGGAFIQTQDITKRKESFFKKLGRWFSRLLKKHPSKTFSFVLRNLDELQEMKISAIRINNAIEKAKSLSQEALAEKIRRDSELILKEERLKIGGLSKYITEKQIVEFFLKCDTKPLSLTYIKNYVRALPPEAEEKFLDAESFCIFDNYVILHFDPLGEGERLTEEEEERRKDPILFGLIRGSRKLYYIVDWEDEVCNLTLDKLLEEIEQSEKNIEGVD